MLIIPLLMLLTQPTKATEPGEEELAYEIRYLYGAINAKVATGTFVLRPDVWEGQDVYTADIYIKVKPLFRLFLLPEYDVTGHFTRPGMNPLHYFCPSGRGWGECRYTEGEKGVHYWRQFDKMPEPEHFYYPNDGRTMELMSLLYFARMYEFVQGEAVPVKMLLAGKIYNGNITLVGEDSERYPGHVAQELHLEIIGRGLMEDGSGNLFVVWRDASGTHPVLGMYVPLGKKGTMLVNNCL